ncbi:MAG: S8/S53 family peptidase [Bacteroidota bacterium]
MKQYIVTATKLNKRRFPVTDLSDKTNITGTVFHGYTFLGEEIPEQANALGKWYRDRDGYYYWGGGVMESETIPPSAAVSRTPVMNDFWFNELGILKIWNDFGEKGEQAKALILDSGVNLSLKQISTAIEEPAKNFVPGSSSVNDTNPNFHGTHCASLIAARDNARFIGAAPAAKLYIGRITESGTLADSIAMKNALKEFLTDGYEFDIISISQTLVSDDPELYYLIGQHLLKSRIVVASIGNDPELMNRAYKRYPGAYDNCFSVGSVKNDRTLSLFSMNPAGTAIFCFGENILSYKDTPEPKPLTGTSQASAIVAGICCLVISFLKKNHFTYDSTAVRTLLTKYATTLPGINNILTICPLAVFDKLNLFKDYETKDLQSCLDADHPGSN